MQWIDQKIDVMMKWIMTKTDEASEPVQFLIVAVGLFPLGLVAYGYLTNNEQIFNVGGMWFILEVFFLVALCIEESNQRLAEKPRPKKSQRINAEVLAAQASLRQIQNICNEPDSR